MHILKIPWFGHQADNKKVGCYTVAINNSGTRLASGGLDGNVKIWNPQSILKYIDYDADDAGDKSRDTKAGSASFGRDIDALDSRGGASSVGAPGALQALSGDGDVPDRALCTMSRHNGAVTCVKFSPNGQYLASGSDDKIVLIWEKEENSGAPRKQFGDLDGAAADLEHWTVRKRLVAHDNDVQDIAWSPDGSLLVTVGLDRSIIIWNGNTFERIKRYDVHQSMVKGIVFDPANKFFATASDDRTVRIFRYHRKHPSRGEHEFQMEHLVMDPFKKSPLTSYFRRMSWSPDGQHIAVPNATNGPVTSVAIINRGNWGTDISLIGHEAPCEVCSFSPRLFQKRGKVSGGSAGAAGAGAGGAGDSKKAKDEFSTVVATGGQDLSLAVWSTTSSTPIVVAANVVEDSITDICWAPDGETLYVSCLDGSITCVKFESGELGGVVASIGTNDLQLNRYGTDRESAIFAESVEQLQLEDKEREGEDAAAAASTTAGTAVGTPAPAVAAAAPAAIVDAIQAAAADGGASPSIATKAEGGESATIPPSTDLVSSSATAAAPRKKLTQNVTITKDGKKRVAPMLVSTSKPSSSPFLSSTRQRVMPSSKTEDSTALSSKLSLTSYSLPRIGIQTSVHGLKSRVTQLGGLEPPSLNQDAAEDQDNDNEDMGIIEESGRDGDASAAGAGLSETTRKRQRNKLRRIAMESRYPTSFRNVSNLPEFLFHHPSALNESLGGVPKEIGNGSDWTISTTYDPNDEDLAFSVVVQSSGGAGAADQANISTIEVRNGPSWSENDDLDYVHNDRIDFQDPTTCIVSNSNDSAVRRYTLYFPFKIQHAIPIVVSGSSSSSSSSNSKEVGTETGDGIGYYALISFSGTFQLINSRTGSFASPSLELGGNAVVVRQGGDFLSCVTSAGLVYVWRLPSVSSRRGLVGVVNGVSIAAIWNCEVQLTSDANAAANAPKKNGLGVELRPGVTRTMKAYEVDALTGSPYVMFEETDEVFQYSTDLMCWVKAVDPWYFLAFDQTESVAAQGGALNGTRGAATPSVISALLHKARESFKSDVKRGSKHVYSGDSKDIQEFKKVVKRRHHEITGLFSVASAAPRR